jgi:hypothetical protein
LCPSVFTFAPELHVIHRFFQFSTLFVLLIEKGKKKPPAKNEENGKKGEKGHEKGAKKGNRERP